MDKELNYNMIAQVVCDTLSMLGISAETNHEVSYNQDCMISNSVLSMVGVMGDFKFNMIFSMHSSTAESIVGIMMGMSQDTLDALGRSALSELSNMMAGGICTGYSQEGINIQNTMPTVINGKSITCKIHSVATSYIEFETQYGSIGINFAFDS